MYTNPFLPTGKSGILLLHEAKFLLSILSTNLMSQTLLKVFVPKALIINLISYNFGSNEIVLVNWCIDSDNCVIVLINPVK